MFGINPGEFAVLLLVVLIVVGPERLPGYAQQLGKMVREGRKMANGLREQVRGELGPEFDDVDWTKLDPRQYDPRRIIREALTDTLEDSPAPKPVSGGGPAVTGAAAAGAAAAGAAGVASAAASTGAAAAPESGSGSTRPASAASPAAAAAVGKPADGGADAPAATPTATPAAAPTATPAATGATSAAAPADEAASTATVPQARTSSGAAIDLEAT